MGILDLQKPRANFSPLPRGGYIPRGNAAFLVGLTLLGLLSLLYASQDMHGLIRSISQIEAAVSIHVVGTSLNYSIRVPGSAKNTP